MIMSRRAQEEIAFKSQVNASLTTGSGEGERRYCCKVDELTLDAAVEKQWKQIGSDPSGLRRAFSASALHGAQKSRQFTSRVQLQQPSATCFCRLLQSKCDSSRSRTGLRRVSLSLTSARPYQKHLRSRLDRPRELRRLERGAAGAVATPPLSMIRPLSRLSRLSLDAAPSRWMK